METNYELKHKCLLVPLKAVLLVLAMVLVGFTTYAQQGKAIKVADNQQLIEAMENSSIGTIELEAGYYTYLNTYVETGTKVVKHLNDDGNRDLQCTFYIIGSNVCFNPENPGDFVLNNAQAGRTECPGGGCCPGPDAGLWTVTSTPVGATCNLLDPLNWETMSFEVNMPGLYTLRYTWAAYNSFVETQYYFFGPYTIELSAPDVCGLTTTVDFVVGSDYPDPDSEIEWWLDGLPYAGPTETGQFDLTVTYCGVHELTVAITPTRCPPDTVSILIDFSCEPTAYAGEDVNVCGELCYFSLIGTTGLYTFSPTHAWSWVQLDGPADLVFANGLELVTSVCAEDGDEPPCAYGEYEVQFQVQNGMCYSEDEMFLRFYEQPVANAGPDQNICNTFGFTLAAVPFEYCGEEEENFWSTSYWEVVSKADPAAVIVFTPDEFAPNALVTVTSEIECPYGYYEFRWVEINSMGEGFGGCEDADTVVVYIHETPVIDAGADAVYCESSIDREGSFVFALDGTEDLPCNQGMAYTYFWSVVDQPDGCTIAFTPDAIDPEVTISDCVDCPYGEYVFSLTQQNGYFDEAGAFFSVCETVDEVTVEIYEQPVGVDAGDDQLLCDVFAFTLTATGYIYCGDEGVNYDNWYSWTLVSQPVGADCEVTITNGEELIASVVVDPCTGECKYGEYVFMFTEYNGTEDVYCEAFDLVTVTIFEQPVAEAGEDVEACVDIAFTPYCYSMTATMDNCYSMYGTWTKSCGPGEVHFLDGVNNPVTGICFDEPGIYKFDWTVTTDALDCEDTDEVVFNLLETPTASGDDASFAAVCDELCFSLIDVGIDKYMYFGTTDGECPNFIDMAHWSYIDGPVAGFDDEDAVTFTDDTDPATEMCVSYYGGYTVRWNEVNMIEDFVCESFFDVFVEFYETPTPFAGDDVSVCGNCYTLLGELYEYLPEPNQHLADAYWWEVLPNGNCQIFLSDPYALQPQVCIEEFFECYGTYGFVLHESNGDCFGSDTVYVCFSEVPGDLAIGFYNDPNDCGPFENYYNRPDFTYNGCLYPDEVLEVCAEGWTELYVDDWYGCNEFDWNNPDFFGWTFEWTLIAPSGTISESEPGYYDFENGWWEYPWIDIFWGECCDTARLYLTITTGLGECDIACENTMEFKFYVYHKPCVNIEGPDVAEVDEVSTYCNVCPEGYDQSCLLYFWTAEHCGIITDGQGTECIDVLWTDYNINGGWGEITLTVFDTCTGCCNYDEMPVKIWPAGTLGDCNLSGYVYYQNDFLTPLNGVEIQLWNGVIPVMTTESFTDVEGGNGMGYYEFEGVNCETDFGITASFDGPWYGANATDALAVELRTIGAPMFPAWFVNQPLQEEAMDVNNNAAITATDALWIKQRAISMVTYFPAGDWSFEPDMSSTAGTYNIMTLNAGDANRSNVPNSTKSAPAIDLVNDGTMNVVTGQEFELPIRIAKADQFGAITLYLGYNSALLEVVDVVTIEGMVADIANGNVSIAWSNLNPMVLADNDVVITLKVKAIGEITTAESMFSIGTGSEFANQDAIAIEPVTLKTFGITTEPAAEAYFLSTNRPNPFSTSTFIEYTMPETGKVKLSVLDMLGQEIAVLVDATQNAGSYTVEFSAAGLATGVYIYKITVDGESRDFISTQRMVISQ